MRRLKFLLRRSPATVSDPNGIVCLFAQHKGLSSADIVQNTVEEWINLASFN